MKQRVAVDARAPSLEFFVPLRDAAGRVQYRLICRGGADQDAIDRLALALPTAINIVAPLMCVLNEGERDSEDSLLAEDSSATWHTRGQFQWKELVGACGRYPEYGRVRHFRLRGFELTLAAENVALRAGQLASFELVVTLRDDRRNRTLHAERPPYLRPRGDCSVVAKGVEPRMCRNAALSYEVCPGPPERK